MGNYISQICFILFKIPETKDFGSEADNFRVATVLIFP